MDHDDQEYKDKEEEKEICERCETYITLIDNNYHYEAELLGECGGCDID